MRYTLDCTTAENHLRIRVDGEWPKVHPEGIIAEIQDLLARHQSLRLLLDLRNMQSEPTPFGDYKELGLLLKAELAKVRIAALDAPDRRGANQFFETMAFNRGLQIHFFYGDEQDATDWLESDRR